MSPKITGVLADISAFLTVLAALPYELGDISELLSPDVKKWVAGIGLVSTLILRLIKRYQTEATANVNVVNPPDHPVNTTPQPAPPETPAEPKP